MFLFFFVETRSVINKINSNGAATTGATRIGSIIIASAGTRSAEYGVAIRTPLTSKRWVLTAYGGPWYPHRRGGQ